MILSRTATEIISISLLSFILWMSNSRCVMAAVGSNCTDTNCAVSVETCDKASNSCVCNDGYTNVSNICKAGLSYSCVSSDNCIVPYAECTSSTCQCKSGYSNVNGVCKAGLGSECTQNSSPQCADSNANCTTKCECMINFYNSSNICIQTSSLQVQNLSVVDVMETSLILKWEKPIKINDVSKYTISWKRLSTNDFLGTQDVSKTDTSVNLSTNLTAGVAYTLIVKSFESSGINISTSIQQATKPYKPGRINVNGSNFDLANGGLNITWHYSGIITGVDIRFSVQLNDSRSSIPGGAREVTTNYCTFPTSGLRNGYWYNVSITAMSEAYNSSAVISRENSDVLNDSFKTTVKVPDPPSNLTCLNASVTNIDLIWTGPVNSNGEIFYYNITVRETSPDIKIYDVRTPRDDLKYTVINLIAGSFYAFEVYTVNEGYQSQRPVIVENCETAGLEAGEPVGLVITNQSSRSGLVTWNGTSNLRGVNYGYSLQIKNNEICILEVIWKCSNCSGLFPTLTSSGCTKNITQNRSSAELGNKQYYEAVELYPDTNYTVTVSAITKPGRGRGTNDSLLTLEEAPQKPYNLNTDKNNISAKEATVTWRIDGPRPGRTSYIIMLAEDNITRRNYTVSGFANTSYKLSGLEEYWNYTLNVEAETRKGRNMSQPYSFQTNIAPAGKVKNCEVRKGGDTFVRAEVSWNLPEIRQRNGPIHNFSVQQEEMIFSKFQVISDSNVSRLTDDEYRTYIYDFQVQPGKFYRFSVSAFNGFIGEACSMNYTAPSAPSEPESRVGALVGGIIGGIVAVVIVIAVIIFILRRSNIKIPTRRKESKKIRKERPISLDSFADHVEIYHRNSNLEFSAEYEELKELSAKHPHRAADLEENYERNRFVNILPFDHSRVKLLPVDGVHGSDYINANYIPGFTKSQEYIACQGPLPSTVEDHWRLIWEQNVHVIVMLTNYMEKGMLKCETYIPLKLEDSKQYGNLVVQCMTYSDINSFEYRTLKVKLEDKERTVKHFHFLNWADNTADITVDVLIDFIKEVRNTIQPSDLEGPIIVHCSAGVGRTGTFIATDVMIQQIDKDGPQSSLDIFNFILKMRENRTTMVQTEGQYILIHDCIKEYLNRNKTYVNQAFSIEEDEHLYQNMKVQLYENVDLKQNTDL